MFVSLYRLQTSVYLSRKVYPIAKSPDFGAFLFVTRNIWLTNIVRDRTLDLRNPVSL